MESTTATGKTIRFKLRALSIALLICVIPLFIVGLILPSSISKQMRSSGMENMSLSAKSTAALIDNEFTHNLSVLSSQSGLSIYQRALSNSGSPIEDPPALEEIRTHLVQTLLALGGAFQEILLCDSEGKPVVCVGKGGTDTRHLQGGLSDRSFFRNARVHHRSSISRPEASAINKVPVIYFTTPILDEHNEFIGMLGLVMEFDQLAQTIIGNAADSKNYGFAVDETGLLVVHPDPALQLKLNIASQEKAQKLAKKMLRGTSGIAHYVSCAGEAKIAAFAPVPVCGWSVAVCMPEKTYYGAGYWIRTWVLFVTCGCALLIGLAGLYVAHSLARKHEAVQSLAESRECFFTAFVNAPNALLIIRASDRCIMEMNSAFGALFKVDPQKMKGTQSENLSVWKLSDARIRIMNKFQAEGGFRDWQTEIPDAEGEIRHCILSMERIFLGSEECYLVQIQDNTRAKQADENQLALQSQLMQTQKVEALGQLSGGVAHDFNNILAAVQLQISFLASNENLSEHSQKLVNECMDTIESGAALTKQLLQFSRRSDFSLSSVDIRELINGLGSMLQRLIGCRHRLDLHLPKEPLVAKVDAGKIQQVLLNLVINARDAMPNGGCIRIEGAIQSRGPEPKTPFIVIQVIDEGTGMTEEVKARLFEPFFTTKQPGRGTGLGLSTTFRIVKEHRGSIEVESELGKGTCFKVILPISAEHGQEAPAQRLRPTVPSSRRRGEGTCVLYVEDEAALRHLTGQIMSRQGYQVLCAANSTEALAHYHKSPGRVHVLVTDIMLPGGMLGTELAVELRKTQPELPVVFTSGVTVPLMPSELSNKGVHSLPKPFRGDALLEVLDSVIN